jgi:hypothetical protein
MKKNLNVRKAQPLKLSRETLRSLENGLWTVVGGAEAEVQVPSVKFCTESGCTTTGG